MSIPKVSVILVNYRGADDTVACLDALSRLDWPRDALEIIVVDNGSADRSVETIRSAAPHATVIVLDTNLGFAAGCNRGAATASGQYVAFLNNDARAHDQWLRAAVRELEGPSSPACVASKVLDWEGERVDFVDAALSFFGHGYKQHVGEVDNGFDTPHDVLFASGAAMVIDRAVFVDAGGFDDRYFMFFEDVDLGWRLWLLGHRVRYVPDSIVYHRHHASMRDAAAWREHYLLERNALFTIYKNYDEEHLATFLAPSLALAIRRGIALGGDDAHALELRDRPSGGEPERIDVHRHTAAAMFAVDGFVEALPSLAQTRRTIQARRRRPDSEILRLFRAPLQPNIQEPSFRAGFDAVVQEMDLGDVFSTRRRILVVTGDSLQPAMAGPAIRAWEIACALSREHDVRLVSTNRCRDLAHPDFEVAKVSAHELRKLEHWCDVLIFQGHLMHENKFVRTSDKVIVVDIYDPFHLEQLEQARDLGEEGRRRLVHASTGVLNEQLARGDLFTCASEKQRDFWLGQLAAVGRINPLTYDVDETLRELVTVVPFGVSDSSPVHGRPAMRGVVPGIGPDDKVVLWGGGIYNWFDPLTLLRAVDKLRARLPSVRLFFLGLRHPNPNVPEMRMAVATRALSDELGLTGTHVFFNEGWVPYEDRQNYLLEADVGVSTHLDHLETEFSFRTRILDYIWAGLPVVATAGDSLAQLIDERGLGTTVQPEDVDALERAMYDLLTDESARDEIQTRMRETADEMRWSKVLEPLLEFCRAPVRAVDLVDADMAKLIADEPVRPPRRPGWRTDIRTIFEHGQTRDFMNLLRKALSRIRRWLRSA